MCWLAREFVFLQGQNLCPIQLTKQGVYKKVQGGPPNIGAGPLWCNSV
jgi:hypothetical protein